MSARGLATNSGHPPEREFQIWRSIAARGRDRASPRHVPMVGMVVTISPSLSL